MADNYYEAHTETEEKKSFTANGAYSKNNPKYIQLQRVESQLNQYALIRTYLGLAFLGAFCKLIWDLCNNPSDSEIGGIKTRQNNIDKIIRIFQMIGYGYGLGSFNKSIFHWKVFLTYFWLSFGLIVYFIYEKISLIEDQTAFSKWGGVALNSANLILNIFLMMYSYKILELMKKRDDLKSALKEEQASFDQAQNMLP